MKVEHREAIERAKLHGVEPMVLAHQLMVHDLVGAALFELRNIKTPFGRLSEEDQQEVIDRITEQAGEAVTTAVGIISSRSVCTIPFKVADSKFKEKSITVTGVVDVQDPNRAGLVDLSGKLVLMVLAPNDYAEGTDGIRAERDQRELPLSASEIIAGAGLDRRQDEEDTSGYDDTPQDGTDPLYQDAVQFVIETRRPSISAIQRHLKIGYNRSASILLGMEQTGIVSAPDSRGAREVLRPELNGTAPVNKEFGDFDYDDAKQLIVLKANGKPFKAHWAQGRLSISSDQVTTLLLRLLDDEVIAVEKEGETALDHSYKVIATLEDVVV
ncbi:DNA translocase FtsK [Pseudomonas plecoglossicida]|uniref:DNA translocase FtsK n=1 Tax=Pseudomonas putida group TaxID=136845 RepID=UPI00241027A4|nr:MULTISPECIES: DNA translocase FtsK [Pseudomonas putida group]MDQ7965542.1 DNA translocase FtsK [Pseudomonas plecoglossicida]WFG03743.1 DNA translocase FtsK [Pseudomonas putida]